MPGREMLVGELLESCSNKDRVKDALAQAAVQMTVAGIPPEVRELTNLADALLSAMAYVDGAPYRSDMAASDSLLKRVCDQLNEMVHRLNEADSGPVPRESRGAPCDRPGCPSLASRGRQVASVPTPEEAAAGLDGSLKVQGSAS